MSIRNSYACTECGSDGETMPVGERKRYLCLVCASNLLGYGKCAECGVWTTDYLVVSDQEYCPLCRESVVAVECVKCNRLFHQEDIAHCENGRCYCEFCRNTELKERK